MIPRLTSAILYIGISTYTLTATAQHAQLSSLDRIATSAEQKVVKIYGAGGFAVLDAYQSGCFISAEGHILTAWSTVLDVDAILAVTSSGERLESKLVGIDPNLEIAILKTDAKQTPCFDLNAPSDAKVGSRILALSNLFKIATGNEMSSVQRGIIMARTELNATRGNFESVYQGPVWVLDATTNNPGAAGGALVDFQGRMVGMLGKELRDENTGIWLSYALPIAELQESINKIIAGESIRAVNTSRKASDRPASLSKLGIALVPDVLEKTPAFIDTVQPDSPAARAGLRSDDLVLFLNSIRIDSQATLRDELNYIDQSDQVTLLLQRGSEIREFTLAP